MTTKAALSTLEQLLSHGGWLQRVARTLVEDESADDLVQETWVAAMRRPPQKVEQAKPWLRKVIRNHARMKHRKQQRRRKREQAVQPPHSIPTPEEWAARLEQQRILAELIDQLPEPQRATLLLHYYEEMTIADIARLQGVPTTTAQSRLQTALHTLRRQLDRRATGDRQTWQLAMIPLALPVGPNHTPPATDPNSADNNDAHISNASTTGAPTSTGMQSKYLAAAITATAVIVAATVALKWLPPTNPNANAIAQPANAAKGDDSQQTLPAATPPLTSLNRDRPKPPTSAQGTLRLEGQVLDSVEQPVAGIRVHLSGRSVPEYWSWDTTLSQRDGSFVFDGLPPGTYDVDVRGPGAYPSRRAHTLTANSDPLTLWIEPTTKLTLSITDAKTGTALSRAGAYLDGTYRAATNTGIVTFDQVWSGKSKIEAIADGYVTQVRWVNFHSQRETARHERFLMTPGASVTGTVRDSSGNVETSGYVSVRSYDETDRDSRSTLGAPVDKHGNYHIGAIRPGIHQLEFHNERTTLYGTTGPIDVGDKPLSGVDIVSRQYDISVMISGRVVDSRGTPKAGEYITHVTSRSLLGQLGRSKADGTFEMKTAPGIVQLSAGTREQRTVAVVDTRETTSGIELKLGPSRGELFGRVVDTTGIAVFDAKVTATPAAGNYRTSAHARSNAAGEFHIVGLRPGQYHLVAIAPVPAEGGYSRIAHASASAGDAELTLRLQTRGGLTGTVNLASGGAPEAFSVLFDEIPAGAFRTQRDGKFQIPSVKPGRYTVTLHGRGFTTMKIPHVRIESNRTTSLGLITLPQRTISGRVVNEQNAAVANAVVRFVGGEHSAQEATTDQQGRFQLVGISRGHLSAVHPTAGRSYRISVADHSSDIELQLRATGTLVGRVIRDNKPVPHSFVLATCERDGAQTTVRSGVDGTFRLQRLPPCNYHVVAELRSSRTVIASHSAHVALTAGNNVPLELTLSRQTPIAASTAPNIRHPN